MSTDPRHPHLSAGYEHAGEPPQGEKPEDLSSLKVDELRELADARGIDHEGMKKADLVDALGG